jgi:hypothetical protein
MRWNALVERATSQKYQPRLPGSMNLNRPLQSQNLGTRGRARYKAKISVKAARFDEPEPAATKSMRWNALVERATRQKHQPRLPGSMKLNRPLQSQNLGQSSSCQTVDPPGGGC